MRDEVLGAHADFVASRLDNAAAPGAAKLPVEAGGLQRVADVPIYFADPLVVPRTTARMGVAFLRAMSEARRDLPLLATPPLALHGGEDTLVPTRVSEPLATLPVVERRVYPGLRHEILNEPEGPAIVAEIVEWIRMHVGGVA